MANLTEKLQIHMPINIGRSDGRIHEATITAINWDQQSVSVEWTEASELKGKELDFKLVLLFNPHLKVTTAQSIALPPPPSRIPVDQGNTHMTRARSSKLRYTMQMHPQARHAAIPVAIAITPTATPMSARAQPPPAAPDASKSVAIVPATEPVTTRQSRVVKNVSKIETERMQRRKKLDQKKAEQNVMLKEMANNRNFILLKMVEEYRDQLAMQPLTHDQGVIEDRLITVCVRKRPLNRQESNKKEVDIVTVPTTDQLIIHEPKTKVDLTKYLDNHIFKFDYTFNEKCTNRTVYKYTAEPLLRTIFDGGFATCFAYGQTGSGKTFTMSGDMVHNEDGIYAMVAADIFSRVRSRLYQHMNFTVTCSFFEIYSKKVLDLLNHKAPLKILEDGRQQVQIVGLTERVVVSMDEVLRLIERGHNARTSGKTSANVNSSRSHAIFQINLKRLGEVDNLHGKFSLIDLAGNERGADTISSNKTTRLEGGEINKSLLALKECIRALGRKGSHLPFRLSKLTQVLRDSFVGSNSKTCMIAMISPGVSSCENTLNTLRYADRVKELGAGEVPTALSEPLTNAENINGLSTIEENFDDDYEDYDDDDEDAFDEDNVNHNQQEDNEVVFIDDDDDGDDEEDEEDDEETVRTNGGDHGKVQLVLPKDEHNKVVSSKSITTRGILSTQKHLSDFHAKLVDEMELINKEMHKMKDSSRQGDSKQYCKQLQKLCVDVQVLLSNATNFMAQYD